MARHEAGPYWRRSLDLGGFGLTKFIATFLFGVQPWDPAVFVAAPLILTAIALLAVWLPAARASRVDPIQALHAE